jgi:hypothetical protein
MTAYHVTTPKKLQRYRQTGYIIPPVRWWTLERSARQWMRKTGRTVLLILLDAPEGWPLPIKGGARWTDQIVRKWVVVDQSLESFLWEGVDRYINYIERMTSKALFK